MSAYDQPAGWGDMSTAFGQAVLIQTAAPHLQPGERLLGVFDLQLDQLLPLSWRGNTSNWNLFSSTYRVIRQLFHGRPWSGKHGTAFDFWGAVRATRTVRDDCDHTRFVMALTDRRMLLLSRDNAKLKEPYRADHLFELPRGTYSLRPNVPNSSLTHRFDVDFADGTWIALMVDWKSKKHDAVSLETLRQITGLLAA